jgi:hypothetical protein
LATWSLYYRQCLVEFIVTPPSDLLIPQPLEGWLFHVALNIFASACLNVCYQSEPPNFSPQSLLYPIILFPVYVLVVVVSYEVSELKIAPFVVVFVVAVWLVYVLAVVKVSKAIPVTRQWSPMLPVRYEHHLHIKQ